MLFFIIVALLDVIKETTTYNFTGECQKVTLSPAYYVIEAGGGKGGGPNGIGGDKVTATYRIRQYTDIYLYIGGTTNSKIGGWNGGDSKIQSSSYGNGGNTDVSLIGTNGSSNWDDNHRNNMLISAKGGNDSVEPEYDSIGTITPNLENATRIEATSNYTDREGINVAEFIPKENGTVTFQSTSYDKDPYAYLCDENNNPIASDDDGGSGAQYNFKITRSVTMGKKYILRIGSFSKKLSTKAKCKWYATFPRSKSLLYTPKFSTVNKSIRTPKIVADANNGEGYVTITKYWEKTIPNKKYNHFPIRKALFLWINL